MLTLADGIVTVAGELQATTLDIGGTNITTTAAEINLIDGGTARGTTAVASGDGILINDGGTMRMTNVDTVSTYFASHSVGGSNIVTTGALNSGSITSGFGTIDTGSSTITTTGLISGGSLDIDNVLIDGTTIGHTDDTDLMTLADGVLTIAGELDATTLDISGNADIDGTTNLDAVDIDGAVQIDATVTVGVDDTGHDVKFFGATSGAYMLWDESADDLIIAGVGGLVVPEGKLTLGSTAVTSTAAELNLLDGVSGLVQADLTKLAAIDASAAELNNIDGDTSATSTTVAGADTVVVNDVAKIALNGTDGSSSNADADLLLETGSKVLAETGSGTMKQVALSDLSTYINSGVTTSLNIHRPTAVAGSNSYSVTHSPGDTILVYRNGILLDDGDVSASAINDTVTFTSVDTSDDITIFRVSALSTTQTPTLYRPTAVAGSNAYSVTHSPGDTILVFINGVLLDDGDVSNDASANTITFSCVDTSDEITIFQISTLASTDKATNVTVYTPTAVAGSNAYTIPHDSASSVLVYRNGVLLGAADITLNSTNNTATFTCTDTSDLIAIHVINAISVSGMTTYRPTAVAGSNAYSIQNDTNDTVNVFKNGVLLDDGDVTLSTSNNTVTFTCASTSDEITIQVIGNISATSDRTAVVKHTPTAVAGSNAYAISNTSGDLVQVFRNGVLLDSSEITVNSTNNTITFTCVDTSDKIDIYVMGHLASGVATEVITNTNTKVKQKGAFMQSSTHQALVLGI